MTKEDLKQLADELDDFLGEDDEDEEESKDEILAVLVRVHNEAIYRATSVSKHVHNGRDDAQEIQPESEEFSRGYHVGVDVYESMVSGLKIVEE